MGVRGWGAGKGSKRRRVKGHILPDGLAGTTFKWREAWGLGSVRRSGAYLTLRRLRVR